MFYFTKKYLLFLLCFIFISIFSYGETKILGEVSNVSVEFSGGKQKAVFTFDNEGKCEVIPYASDIIRVKWHWNDIVEEEEVAVDKKLSEWENFSVDFLDESTRYLIQTSDLIVEVIKTPNFKINFIDRESGYYILKEKEVKYDLDYDPLQDSTYNNLNSGSDIPNWYRVRSEKEMEANEAFFGVGAYAGKSNRRGSVIQCWNMDSYGWTPEKNPLYLSLPFFYGVKPSNELHPTITYGIFFNNTVRPTFFFGKDRTEVGTNRNDLIDTDDKFTFEAGEGELDYFFFGGGSDHKMKNVLTSYTELTGKPAFLPKWAYGYHMSRFSFFQNDIEDMIDVFRDNNIPLDAIYIDLDYIDQTPDTNYGDSMLHQLKISDVYFPNMTSMVNKAKDNKIKLIPIMEAWLTYKDPNYFEAKNNGYFLKDNDGNSFENNIWVGKVGWFDFTNSGTKTWWGEKLSGFVNDNRFDGIWNDLNEPSDQPGTNKIPLNGMYSFDGKYGSDKNDYRNWHLTHKNSYNYYQNKFTYETLKNQNPNKRPFILTRASWVGTQKYALGWSGDNANEDLSGSHGESMKANIRLGTSVMISGQVNFGHDVGGFVGGASGLSMTRWTEWTAFTPLFRNHSDKNQPRREPYQYSDLYRDTMIDSIKLRYKFLPYLYTLAYNSSITGIPMNLPKVFNYTNDTNTYDETSDFDFLVGDFLLVAPALDKNDNKRDVYLPEGDDWYYWYSNSKYSGGQSYEVNASIGNIPLFVREGSIIPMSPEVLNTSDRFHHLELNVWPGKYTEFTQFEDDGESDEYINGEYRKVKFTNVQNGNDWEFNIYPKEGVLFNPDINYYIVRKRNAGIINSLKLNNIDIQEVNSKVELDNYSVAYFYDENKSELFVKVPNNNVLNTLISNETPVERKVKIFYKSNWESTYAHYNAESKGWTVAPGEIMAESIYSGYKFIEIDAASMVIVFNDGGSEWDNNNRNDYLIDGIGVYTIENNLIKLGPPENLRPIPQNLKVTSFSETFVNLEWDSISNADEYEIYRDNTFLQKTTYNTFTDETVEPQKTYYYKVCAVYGTDKSDFSNVVDIFTGIINDKIEIYYKTSLE